MKVDGADRDELYERALEHVGHQISAYWGCEVADLTLTIASPSWNGDPHAISICLSEEPWDDGYIIGSLDNPYNDQPWNTPGFTCLTCEDGAEPERGFDAERAQLIEYVHGWCFDNSPGGTMPSKTQIREVLRALDALVTKDD